MQAGSGPPDGLREVPRVRQRGGEGRRRWFTCPSTDLFVWEQGGHVVRVELCYGKPHDEHTLSWDAEWGVAHMRIDDGEAHPSKNRTPIAVPDGLFDASAVALEFERVGAGVDPRVYRQVLGLLHGI